MATGTGNLPNPSMAFTPFDILLAEELNDLVENIESLATGAGIGDGAIGTSDLANGAVTSAKVDFATLLTNKKFIQTGKSSISSTGTNVTFPVPFDNAPIVVLTAHNTGDNTPETAKITAVTTTQVNIHFFYGTTRNTGAVNWVAIDITKLAIAPV